MIISCPACSSRYDVPAERLAPQGREVRCAKCGHNWFQSPYGPDELGGHRPPLPPENLATKESVEVGLRKTQQRSRSVVWLLAPALILFCIGIFIALPSTLSGVLPFLAPVYAQLGLTSEVATTDQQPTDPTRTGTFVLGDIERKVVEMPNMTILVFTGQVSNEGSVEADVPEIRVSLLDEKGVSLDFWPAQIAKPKLGAGESTTWTCRFFNPPMDRVSEHKVSFVSPLAL